MSETAHCLVKEVSYQTSGNSFYIKSANSKEDTTLNIEFLETNGTAQVPRAIRYSLGKINRSLNKIEYVSHGILRDTFHCIQLYGAEMLLFSDAEDNHKFKFSRFISA